MPPSRHAARPATRIRTLGGLCLLALLWTTTTVATGLQVSPTTVVIAAERQAEGLLLHNQGSRVLQAQVRVFAWSQDDGEDRLSPTGALVPSPPMLTLAPGQEQLVRVVRTGPPPSSEAAYRLIVDELPDPPSPTQQGLRLLLRYSIPVFLQPPLSTGVPQSDLRARLVVEDGQHRLELHNAGAGHAQVADLKYVTSSRSTDLATGLAGYVLPGQRRRWPLPAGLGGGDFRARINGEPVERTLPLDR